MTQPLLLLVEDDPLLQRAYKRFWRSSFHIVGRESVEEALEWIAAGNEPDVIVSDYNLAGPMTGGDFYHELDGRLRQRFVFVSGSDHRDEHDIKGVLYFRKPANLAELKEVLLTIAAAGARINPPGEGKVFTVSFVFVNRLEEPMMLGYRAGWMCEDGFMRLIRTWKAGPNLPVMHIVINDVDTGDTTVFDLRDWDAWNAVDYLFQEHPVQQLAKQLVEHVLYGTEIAAEILDVSDLGELN